MRSPSVPVRLPLSCLIPVLCAGLALTAAPVRAMEGCTPGLAVITPDGDVAEITGENAGGCIVTRADGATETHPADLLMPDFGAAAEPDMPSLSPGRYLCRGPGLSPPFALEITEDGFYLDGDGEEGSFAIDEGGTLEFIDGPLAGQPGSIDGDGLHVVPKGLADPAGCLPLDE